MPRWLIALGLVGALLLLSTRTAVNAVLKLIADFEKLRLDVYQDSGGAWTVGYGHLVKPGERFHPYGPVRRITVEEATQLLTDDTRLATQAVDQLVRVPLSDSQRAALISLVFNIGIGAFQGSTLLRKLNAGDYRGAAAEFPRWNKDNGVVVQGLVNRRAQEQAIFNA